MKSFTGTTDELREQIQWLEDDIIACQNAMKLTNEIAEKGEYRHRIMANRQELVHLKSLLSVGNP